MTKWGPPFSEDFSPSIKFDRHAVLVSTQLMNSKSAAARRRSHSPIYKYMVPRLSHRALSARKVLYCLEPSQPAMIGQTRIAQAPRSHERSDGALRRSSDLRM